MSERLLKLNHGRDIDRINKKDCYDWPKSISTRPIENSNYRDNSIRRKPYNQEDPCEMSSSVVGLCRKSYFEPESFIFDHQQKLQQSASTSLVKSATSWDPVHLFYTALSEYTNNGDWSDDEIRPTHRRWFCDPRDPFSPLSSELEKNDHPSVDEASATTFQATNSLSTITTCSVEPYSLVETHSSSLPSSLLPLPSIASSTNVDADDIQSRKLATGCCSKKVHFVPPSGVVEDVEKPTSSEALLAKRDFSVIVGKKPHDRVDEDRTVKKEALLRGVFSCEDDALLFEQQRTMESKITKKMMSRSRHQRSVCKTNNTTKTPDHNTIATTNDNCSNNDLTEVSDHYDYYKLGCSCVCATDTIVSSSSSSPSYLGTLCARHPSSGLLATTWPVYNNNNYNNPHARPYTLTNNNYYNNNKTVNKNTTISNPSQTTTTKTNNIVITTQQENAPSKRVVPDLCIFNYLTSMWFSRSAIFCSYLDTCRGRTTSLSTRSATWKLRNYILLAINILAFFTCVAGQCKVSTCQKQWPTYHMNSMDMDNPSDPHNCRALRTTWHCIRKVSHGCVGSIDYHSEKSRVQKQMSIRKCSLQGETYDSSDKVHRPTVQRPQPECIYKGKGTYKHCGLFGDPHLRTFNRVCQTCKIRGAWPLVDNNRLTVMVTNKPVVVDGSATATSMLTVRIRRNELCGANHFVTYETQANNLPSTFVDGRTHYGPGNGIELKVLEPNKHIKIHIKYIDTTILVRQIGRYFTFALWMPEEVVKDSNGNVPELCVRGCPKSEQINYQEFLAQKRQKLMEYKTQNKLVMSRPDAETLCRQAKVVDFYFDSCVFDLMTTGDRNFTVAAYSALHDLLKLNPEEVNENRTDLRPYDQRYSGSASTRTLHSIPKLIMICMTLLSLHTYSRLEEIC